MANLMESASHSANFTNSIARGRSPYAGERSQASAGTLWQHVRQASDHALQAGALQSISTTYEWVEDGGVTFLVRILNNLNRKEAAKKRERALKAKGEHFNPFLPYEQDLFVTDLSPTHVCLLNKFNVVDHHVLIVTRDFEHQNSWLNKNDFAALWVGLREIDGLAFYNGGKTAGASQRHKHLQLVPLPFVPDTLTPDSPFLPIESVLSPVLQGKSVNTAATPLMDGGIRGDRPLSPTVSGLPFAHALVPLDLSPDMPPQEATARLCTAYQTLLEHLSISGLAQTDCHTQPYNMLITRRWMLLVPRAEEKAYTISINSLGFAGSLFVKNRDQLEQLKQCGPMALLKTVACS